MATKSLPASSYKTYKIPIKSEKEFEKNLKPIENHLKEDEYVYFVKTYQNVIPNNRFDTDKNKYVYKLLGKYNGSYYRKNYPVYTFLLEKDDITDKEIEEDYITNDYIPNDENKNNELYSGLLISNRYIGVNNLIVFDNAPNVVYVVHEVDRDKTNHYNTTIKISHDNETKFVFNTLPGKIVKDETKKKSLLNKFSSYFKNPFDRKPKAGGKHKTKYNKRKSAKKQTRKQTRKHLRRRSRR